MMRLWFVGLFLLGFLGACRKTYIQPESGSLNLDLKHEANGVSVIFREKVFTNAAGNVYSITRLEYYLSHISLLKTTGEVFEGTSVFYINAERQSALRLSITDVPKGGYSGIRFTFGLPPEKNKTNYLPNEMDHIGMSWPDPMGGGYHFMKLEGHYNKSDSTQGGYAIHLGRDTISFEITLSKDFTITHKNHRLGLIMDVNEWFANPYLYDLNLEDNYTMGSIAAMLKIKQNGQTVFKLE